MIIYRHDPACFEDDPTSFSGRCHRGAGAYTPECSQRDFVLNQSGEWIDYPYAICNISDFGGCYVHKTDICDGLIAEWRKANNV